MSQSKNNISVQIVILVGLVMVAGMFFKYASEVYKDYKINAEIEDLKVNIQSLKEENEELLNYLEYLDTESYQEIVAKKELNLRKPGEEVVVIHESLASTINDQAKQETKTFTYIPIYMKWWRLFFPPSGESKENISL